MGKFENTMRKNPPHVAISYNPETDGYSYGVNGTIPIGQLVGYITRVQAELLFRNPDPCDPNMCIIAYDPSTKKMFWFVDSNIPVDALVGTLELVKCVLLSSQMASMAQATQKRAPSLIY